jgi:hypothetical protein
VIENSIIDTAARVFLLSQVTDEASVESLIENQINVIEFSIIHALSRGRPKKVVDKPARFPV